MKTISATVATVGNLSVVRTKASQIDLSAVPSKTVRLNGGISATRPEGKSPAAPAGMKVARKVSNSSSACFMFISRAYCVRLATVAFVEPVMGLPEWYLVEDGVAFTGVPATFALWSSGTEVFDGVNDLWILCSSAPAVRGTRDGLRNAELQADGPSLDHSPFVRTLSH